MISQELEVTLHKAFVDARQQRHEFISVEHLLLALLDNNSARKTLTELHADLNVIRKSLRVFINKNIPIVSGKDEVDTQPTLGFQRVIQRAIMHVQAQETGGGKKKEKKEVTGDHLLVAIFGEKDSHAVYCLREESISRIDVVNYLYHGITTQKDRTLSGEDQVSKITATATPSIEIVSGDNTNSRLRVFISYSHLDSTCLDRLLVHLKPLSRQKLIDCWSDKNIRIGDKWKPEVLSNLEKAAVAVLLISADFLASDFIVNQELPPLLISAEAKGLRILPVILKPCGFLRDKTLNSFQSLNDPIQPLLGMSMIEQEHLYDKIAQEIHNEIEMRNGLT